MNTGSKNKMDRRLFLKIKEITVNINNLPVFFGVILGFSAIFAEVVLKFSPPNSYGVCMICHTMDTINWIINKLTGSDFQVQNSSQYLPLLTSFAIIGGGAIAAKKNKEFKFKVVSNIFLKFILGFLIMSFALIAMGCPIRLTLLVTYGDGMALFSFVGLILGVITGTVILKKRHSR
jgi:hypothetical protein